VRRLPKWLVLLLCVLLFLQPAYWIGLLDIAYAAGNVSDSFADSTKIDGGNSSGHLVTGGQLKMDQGNYFGDGSDGAVTISSNTSLTNAADGDYVVKEYSSLTINSSTTLTTQNRSKGLLIYVKGNAIINGTLSMTARGASADPVAAGVSATGLRLPLLKSGSTDTLSVADFAGAGTGVISSVANQPAISGDGKIYTIARAGGAGAQGGVSSASQGSAGGTLTSGTGGGAGGGNGNGVSSASTGWGVAGTVFSGGGGAGGYGSGGSSCSLSAVANGGAGGAGCGSDGIINAATGGTITYSGGKTIHTFTSSGDFVVSAEENVEYLVVAGGGAGGTVHGAGGGAGGFRSGTDHAVTIKTYAIVVGLGGNDSTNRGERGGISTFDTITAAGGGGGGSRVEPYTTGLSGGSGGGGGGSGGASAPGGAGDTPDTTPDQGEAGGAGFIGAGAGSGGGGGGANEAGENAASFQGGDGGDGKTSSISGSSVYYAGGAGGGAHSIGTKGLGGLGGGADGSQTASTKAPSGTDGLGGGGGGASDGFSGNIGGDGGNGIVIISYDTVNEQEGGGGAGNSGGVGGGGGASGSSGTGGILWLIVGGNLTIGSGGSLQAMGSNGGNVSDDGGGGGASGGGVVYALYGGSLSNSGSVSVAGGTGGTATYGDGGAGGAGYSLVEQVGSPAYSSIIQSTNLLSGASNVSDVSSFVYNLSSKPAGTGATVQFSQNESSWYNSSGSLDGTDALTTGTDNSIDISGLGWLGSNFYYKVNLTSSDGLTTSILDDVKVNYLQTPVAPTIGSATALSSSSMRWGFSDNANNETGFRVFDTGNTQKAECSTADLSYCDETGLSPNVSYTRKVAGYNGDGNGVYSSTANKYTWAVPATSPSVSNAQSGSLDVVLDNSSNPAGTEMALYKETGASCDGSGGSYVAADGSDNASTPVWQDESSWGTVTVSGLTEMTEYGFCTIARNEDSVSTTWSGTDSGTTIEDTPPSISSVDSVAGDASATYYDQSNDSSTVIAFTSTDGAGGGVSACKWDTSDVAYDSMGNSCGSASSCTVDLSGEESKTVYIRCSDVYGNKMGSSQQVDYVIDATAPSSLSAGNSSSSWVKDKPSVVVSSPTDGGSGLAEIRYVWDSNDLGVDCSGGSVTSASTDLTSSLSSGSHVLYLCAKDNAGNVSSWNGAYKWDGGNPVVNITTHVLTSYRASNIPAKIEGTASDAVSAVASVAVSIYDGALYWSGTIFDSLSRVWMSATGTDTWEYTFSPSSDGSYVLRSRSTDSAGNTQESSDTSFGYDTGTPGISVAEVSTPDTTSVVIAWSTDETSSTQVEYGLNSSYGSLTAESDTAVRVSDHDKSISSLGSCVNYHYRVKSSDGAGNQLVGEDKTFTTTGCVGSAEVEVQVEEEVNKTVGGSVELQEDGITTIELTVPANFSDSDADFQIKKIDKDSVLLATSTPSSEQEVIGSNVYQLDALKSVDEKITSFDEAITITMSYTEADIEGKDESSLQIYRWDGVSWNVLSDCSVNAAANQISCTTSNFSTFVLFGEDSVVEGGSSSAVVESYSTDECSGQAPGYRAPWIYGAIPQSSSSIKLFMTDGDQPINKYLLIYGEDPGVYKYGTEDMGGYGGGFKQYVVSDLKPGITYYFKVVGKNGCKFGSWSNEMRMSTLGGDGGQVNEAISSMEIENRIVSSDLEVESTDDDLLTEIDNKMEEGEEMNGVGETVNVSKGESLWSIADETWGDGDQWTELVELNRKNYPSLEKNPGYIEIGWELRIDEGSDSDIVDQVKGVSDSFLNEVETEGEMVTVSKGESLWSVADEVRGNGYEWTELVEMNRESYPSLEKNPDYIEIGWQLRVNEENHTGAVDQVGGVGYGEI